MKRILLALILSTFFLAASAQDFEIVGVESLPADMSAREEIKTDHNDRQCALLRVATQNIAPNQREGFSFVLDLGSEVVERATRDGEIWLWVSPGMKYLRIKHRDWGQYELRLQDYVMRVEALHTYKVTIRGTLSLVSQEQGNNAPTQQYLAFRISPANATLFVNDELWDVGTDGTAVRFVNFGTYNYRVMAPNHVAQTGTVTVNDPDNTQTVPVTLKPDFVEVTLKVDADAEIWVNNEKKGMRSWTGNLGKGTYKIECKQAGHETSMITKEITTDLDGQTINLPKPTPIYGSLNIESTPSFATVYIDGKMVGETPKFVKEILTGHHELRLTKDGYTDYTETITIVKGDNPLKAVLNNDGTVPPPVKPQQPKPEQPSNRAFFVMANAAYSIAPQTSFGLMLGSVKKFGWYANFNTNFSFSNSTDYECDDSGLIFDYLRDYKYSGEKKTSRLAISAGMMFRIRTSMYAYVGGGYGYRSLLWQFYDSDYNYVWAKNTDCSYKGFTLDAGLMQYFSSFAFSIGVQTIGFNYLEAKIGIGIIF